MCACAEVHLASYHQTRNPCFSTLARSWGSVTFARVTGGAERPPLPGDIERLRLLRAHALETLEQLARARGCCDVVRVGDCNVFAVLWVAAEVVVNEKDEPTDGEYERFHGCLFDPRGGQRLAGCQTLEGSFSAVWTATIARKDAFCRDFRDLQDLHSFAPL